MVGARRVGADLPEVRDEAAERRAIGHDDREVIQPETAVLRNRMRAAAFLQLEQRRDADGPSRAAPPLDDSTCSPMISR